MFLLALPVLLIACGEPGPDAAAVPPAPRRPDLVLVTVDTLRADRVGAYGDPLAATPTLDRVASEGVLFRDAVAAAPLTLPSHASLLTGLLPAHHGLRDNGGFRLADDVLTLAEALQAGGYRTGAFVSAFVLDRAWGLDQGFDVYRAAFHPADVSAAPTFAAVETPGADTVNAARAFLRDAPASQPTFCWVHLYDPHTPWAPHPGSTKDPYRGEVAFADTLVGRLLADVADDAVLVITGDHGEGLWDHGEREHGVLLHRATTRVPLLVRPGRRLQGVATPAVRPISPSAALRPEGMDLDLVLDPVPDAPRAARVVEVPVSGVDVAATLADYGGVSLPGDGVSLRVALEGRPFTRDPVFAETHYPRFHLGWSDLALLQDGSTRYLRVGAASPERYDLAVDPAELDPRPDVPAGIAVRMEALAGPRPPTPGPLSADAEARLQALGYLTSASTVEEGADPRARIGAVSRLHALEALPPAEALPALRALVRQEPGLVDARMALVRALFETGDAAGALAETVRVLDQQPAHTQALSNAVMLHRTLGRPADAMQYALRMQAENPRDPRGYRWEIALWVDREAPDEVLRVSTASLAIDPEDPFVLYLQGLALFQKARYDEAIVALDAASRHGSRAGDIPLYLGACHERAGRPDEAMGWYQRYTQVRPEDLRGWARLGWLYYKKGDCAWAMRSLKNVTRRGVHADPEVQEALDACDPTRNRGKVR